MQPASLEATLDEALQAGDLSDAYDRARALLAASSPPSPQHQALVAVLAAQLDRFDDADAALDALAAAHPTWRGQAQALSVCLTLARALWARRHDPDDTERAALDPPPADAHTRLTACLAFAQRTPDAIAHAASLLRGLPLPHNPGRLTTTSGRVLPFISLHDPDALTGPVLVACGPLHVVDVPFSTLRTLSLDPPRAYHDQIWPVARLTTHSGKSLTARLSARYPDTASHPDPQTRLGLCATFHDHSGVLLGFGARTLRLARLDGSQEDIPFTEVARLDL